MKAKHIMQNSMRIQLVLLQKLIYKIDTVWSAITKYVYERN